MWKIHEDYLLGIFDTNQFHAFTIVLRFLKMKRKTVESSDFFYAGVEKTACKAEKIHKMTKWS